MPTILAVNGGSSSIKWFRDDEVLTRTALGKVDGVGLPAGTLTVTGPKATDNLSHSVAPDRASAVKAFADWAEEHVARDTLAAVGFDPEHLRARLPDLKVPVVNVVDLMRLHPQNEHPHGLRDVDFDELFTTHKPVIFAFHAHPWLIHRLTYRRTNHANIHVRGYKEEGTVTTPFDMTVLNEQDRVHLVMDVIDGVPEVGEKGIYLKQQLEDKLVEHRHYIAEHGLDMPEIRNWKWGAES